MRPTPRKGNLALYATLLLASLLAMWMLRQCSSRPVTYDDTERRPGGDTLCVAIEYSPMAIMSRGDTLTGLAYEMLKQMSSSYGIPMQFRPVVSLTSALEGLESGRFDVVVAEMPMTAEFKERYALTEPVYLDRQVLIQRRDSSGRVAVSSQLDLARRHIRMVAGSPAIDRITNLSREIGDTIFIDADTIHSTEQLIMLTGAGEVPLAVVNEGLARSMAADYPRLDITTAISFTQFQSWLLAKDKKQKTAVLDSAIVKFRSTDAYRALVEKWGVSAAE